MKINELYNQIKDNFGFDYLEGDLTLKNKFILWSYSLDGSCDSNKNNRFDDYCDEEDFNYYNDLLSSEEILRDAYDHDIEILNGYLDEIDEDGDWTITEPNIHKISISFRIY